MKKKINKSIDKHGVNIILEREDVFITPKDLKFPGYKDTDPQYGTPSGMKRYRLATDFTLSVEKELDDEKQENIPVSIKVYIRKDDFQGDPDQLSYDLKMGQISDLKLANWTGTWQSVDITRRAIFAKPMTLIDKGPEYYGYITSAKIDISGDPPVAVGR